MLINCCNTSNFCKIFIHAGVWGSSWYVSVHSTDADYCGHSVKFPCSDLHHVISHLTEGDTVYIDSTDTIEEPIELCVEHYINKSFTINGINGRPAIQCTNPDMDEIILWLDSTRMKGEHGVIVRLENLYFKHGYIVSMNVNVYIVDCVFGQSTIIAKPPQIGEAQHSVYNSNITFTQCLFINVQVFNVSMLSPKIALEWYDLTYSPYDLYIPCAYMVINITKSFVIDRKLHIIPGTLGGTVNIIDVEFTNSGMTDKIGGISIFNQNVENDSVELPTESSLMNESVELSTESTLMNELVELSIESISMNESKELATGSTLMNESSAESNVRYVNLSTILINESAKSSTNSTLKSESCINCTTELTSQNEPVEFHTIPIFTINIIKCTFTDHSIRDTATSLLMHHLDKDDAVININTFSIIQLFINNSIFSNNNRAIAIYKMEGEIIITMCTFTNHTHIFDGGVIYARSQGALKITLQNDTFTSNVVRMSNMSNTFQERSWYMCHDELCTQIDIWEEYGAANIRETIANANNETISTKSSKYLFTGKGGAIYYETIKTETHKDDSLVHDGLMVDGCTFGKNMAVLGSSLYLQNATAKLSNSYFQNNLAYDGGAFYFNESYINIMRCEFSNNSATRNGGAMFYNKCSTNITYSKLINNSAVLGGGIMITHSSLNVYSCGINLNNATNIGAGVFASNSSIHLQSFGKDHDNSADWLSYLSKIMDDSVVSAIISNAQSGYCLFLNNSAEFGAAIAILRGSFLTMSMCQLSFNKNSTIYVEASQFEIITSMMTYNYDTNQELRKGHGVCLNLAMGSNGSLILSVIRNNQAVKAGAIGLFDQSKIIINTCDISYTNVTQLCGAVQSIQSYVFITNSVISHNYCAGNGSALFSYGGPVKHQYSHVTITNSRMQDNKANQAGGAIFAYISNVLISQSNISRNFAKVDGGGLYSENSKLVILHSNISGNTAARTGGAACLTYTNLFILHSTISGNFAKYHAGGLYSQYGTIHVSNSSLTNNRIGTPLNGSPFAGAIFILDNEANAKIEWTQFKFNSATHYAGAVFVYRSTIIISNCWFIQNEAVVYGGGGMYVLEGQVLIMDSQFVSNIAGSDGGAILIRESHASILKCNFLCNHAIRDGGVFELDRGTALMNDIFMKNNTVYTNSLLSVKGDANMTLSNIWIESDPTDDYINSNMYIYSQGIISYNNITMLFPDRSSKHPLPVISHVKPGKMYVNDMTIQCPQRFQVITTNESEKNIFNSFIIQCDTFCENGYLAYNESYMHVYSVEDSYSNQTLIVSDIIQLCHPCPYGGICVNEMVIIAKPDFWGIVQDSLLEFYPCLSSHCVTCEHHNCTPDTFNQCAPNREGLICTQCSVNYTEALFSSLCVSNELCKDNWILTVAIIAGTVYAIFLIFQNDFTNFFTSNPFSNVYKEQKYDERPQYIQEEGTQEKEKIAISDKTEFLITLFYYFQDSALFYVGIPYINEESPIISSAKSIIAGLFEFRLDLFHLASDVCIFAGMNQVQKLMLKTLLLPLIWCIILSVYAASKTFRKSTTAPKISKKAAGALMLSVLFTFSKLASVSLSLLECIHIKDSSVLLLQATVTCYTTLQKLLFVFVTLSIIPFGLYQAVIPKMLFTGNVALPLFFLGCLFPLPVMLILLLKQLFPPSSTPKDMSADSQKVYALLQEPYREIKVFGFDICWGGIILFRRTLLIVIYTYIQYSLLRIIFMLGLSVISLMLHITVWPYADKRSNIAETISGFAIISIAVINVARAIIDSEQETPKAPTQSMLIFLDYVDQVLQLWLPLVGMGILLMVLIGKIGILIIKKLRHKKN